jgi:hypothetical protein
MSGKGKTAYYFPMKGSAKSRDFFVVFSGDIPETS